MVLPGEGDARELKDIETLIGEVEIERLRDSISRGSGVSHQDSRQEKRVLWASEIHTFPFGTRLLFFRNVKPTIVKLRPWTELPISVELLRDRDNVAQCMTAASTFADRLGAFGTARGSLMPQEFRGVQEKGLASFCDRCGGRWRRPQRAGRCAYLVEGWA